MITAITAVVQSSEIHKEWMHMKKFLMVTPQQPEGNLKLVRYDAQGVEALEYEGETRFPVIPLINGYVEDGEEVKLITVTYDYEYCRTNLELLRGEVADLEEKRGITCSIESIEVPFDDRVGAMMHIFLELIDRIDDGDVLHACITYGSKPTPMVLMMVMQYCYRIMTNVTRRCIVYGQRDWNTGITKIYDVTQLVRLDEIVRRAADLHLEDPEEFLRELIES